MGRAPRRAGVARHLPRRPVHRADRARGCERGGEGLDQPDAAPIGSGRARHGDRDSRPDRSGASSSRSVPHGRGSARCGTKTSSQRFRNPADATRPPAGESTRFGGSRRGCPAGCSAARRTGRCAPRRGASSRSQGTKREIRGGESDAAPLPRHHAHGVTTSSPRRGARSPRIHSRSVQRRHGCAGALHAGVQTLAVP